MQETCRRSTDLAMPSNIRLENKIGNPRTLKKIRNQNEESIDRCGVGSDWDPIFSILYVVANVSVRYNEIC